MAAFADFNLLTLGLMALGLAATGLVGGTLAGLLGIGGGIVIVPVLYHVLAMLGIDEAVRMHLAVGTSLATIIPTSIRSARAHYRRGGLDTDLLRGLGPAVAVGAVVGVAVSRLVPGTVLGAVFAVVAIAVALNMAAPGRPPALAADLPGRAVLGALGGLIGALSTLMGIGGGTLTVPALSLYNVPIHRAVGTAAALGVVISIPGAIGFVASGLGVPGRLPGSLGYVNLIGLAFIIPLSLLAAPWGASLAHRIQAHRLRQAFAVFLIVTAVRMLVDLWS